MGGPRLLSQFTPRLDNPTAASDAGIVEDPELYPFYRPEPGEYASWSEVKPLDQPRGPVDHTVVARAAALGCTVDNISYLVGMPPSEFRELVANNRRYGDAIEIGRSRAKTRVWRLLWAQAHAGNTRVLLHLAHHVLGQRASTVSLLPEGQPSDADQVSIDPVEVARRLAYLLTRGSQSEEISS